MRILTLEDDPQRHVKFRENLSGAHLLIVEKVEDAIAKLKDESWDWLFLDHDLGGQQMVDSSDPTTGYWVAKWLEENPDRQPGNIIIHTCNTPGAKNMLTCLPDAQYVPFAWMKVAYK